MAKLQVEGGEKLTEGIGKIKAGLAVTQEVLAWVKERRARRLSGLEDER